MDTSETVNRGTGTTTAERYLKKLCDKSFLSLWSYPNIFRDQNSRNESGRKGEGKEVCDLLVVFENHFIIFSDKDCEFPDTGSLDVDWSRWFRKAIEKSAKQVFGAERWIRDFPDRLFLDRACTQPFPVSLPISGKTIVHRIVVAHGSTRRCRQVLGGSGSLIIAPRIVGGDHKLNAMDGGMPFAVGQLNPEKGYVHVLDDTTLDLVLRTLDTATDFVEYLSKKEELILNDMLVAAAGEEDLLAYYLQHFDDSGQKGFVLPDDINSIGIDEGLWEEFSRSPQRHAQLQANGISYFWDSLIETFNHHLFAGTQYQSTGHTIKDLERVLRFLARENRTGRRMLSKLLLDFVRETSPEKRATRIVKPSRPGDPYYVFLVVPQLPGISNERYRRVRRNLLNDYLTLTKFDFPDAEDIIGIATETARGAEGSEDIAYFDARSWTNEDQATAKRLKRKYEDNDLLGQRSMFLETDYEYPVPPVQLDRTPRQHHPMRLKGRDRNKSCPCGSGKKYKFCCGAQ